MHKMSLHQTHTPKTGTNNVNCPPHLSFSSSFPLRKSRMQEALSPAPRAPLGHPLARLRPPPSHFGPPVAPCHHPLAGIQTPSLRPSNGYTYIGGKPAENGLFSHPTFVWGGLLCAPSSSGAHNLVIPTVFLFLF